MEDTPKALALQMNLMAQVQAWARHNNRAAYDTRDRYERAMSGFCEFAAAEFKLQKLANVTAKHLQGYVYYLVEKGNAASTIKTNLSGVRFVLDSFPGRERAKPLPSNEELEGLVYAPKRAFLGIDRAWSNEEFVHMVNKAMELERPLVAYAMGMGYALGLRIHEVMQIDHNRVTRALQNGVLTVKGKGGLWRDVPLNDLARRILEDIRKQTDRGARCFVESGNVVHQQIASIQRFIRDHRGEIEVDKKVCEVRDAAYLRAVAVDGYKPHITFHGLRHSYARRLYTEQIQKGVSQATARKYVAECLGHGRDAVTRIYLGTLQSTVRKPDSQTKRGDAQ